MAKSKAIDPREVAQKMDDKIMGLLTQAWNIYVRAEQTHPDDTEEFKRAIHAAQSVMALRQLRRTDPTRWPPRMLKRVL